MSRIYLVTHRRTDTLTEEGTLVRFVRASTMNGAIRAVAADLFHVEPASTDDIVRASQNGSLDILDALAEPKDEGWPEDAADPGPVPDTRIVSTWQTPLLRVTK